MLHKITLTLTLLGITVSTSFAATANDYLITGRAQLFSGTVSGLQSAYQTFNNGVNDNTCADCAASRELKFFRAAAGTAMLFVRDDGDPINSWFELLNAFDISTSGQYWAPYYDTEENTLNFEEARNQRDCYEIPVDAPNQSQIRDILDDSMIPAINAVIADLDAITDSPNRFRVYLTADEVRVFFGMDSDVFDPGSEDYDPDSRFLSPLEVDRGEVYILKGILVFIRGQLQNQQAYDTFISEDDPILEKWHGEWLGIKKDVLDPYPNFMKVAPTANNPANGKALLAQARLDLLDAIDYYKEAIAYIRNENNPVGTDPQDDELIYIDPDSNQIMNALNDRLTTLRNSLTGDTVGVYPIQTTKTYQLTSGASNTWRLALNYNLIDEFDDSNYGSFISTNSSAPRNWEIEFVELSGNYLEIELDCEEEGIWASGFLTATLSSNKTTISNGTFEYWGDENGTINGLSGSLNSTTTDNENLDLNPIYGSTGRYANPVAPRNLLPTFDSFNAALPNTVGSGLGNDPTLGGILPDWTQTRWQTTFELQPAGTKAIYLAASLPITIDGSLSDWRNTYRLFTDPAGDLDDEAGDISGVDISQVYLVRDSTYLYGAIEFYDDIENGYYYHVLKLSYSANDNSSLHTIVIYISISDGDVDCALYYLDNTSGWLEWDYIPSDLECRAGSNAVEFRVSLNNLPGSTNGRYVSVDTEGWSDDWYTDGDDSNPTHIQIGQTGTITGTVSFNGDADTAIFVYAYTDLYDPEESMVSKTMITGPGSYTLSGVGVGWSGYVRASTPVFGFDNPFELDCFDVVSNAIPVTLTSGSASGKNLTLTMPILLQNNQPVSGNINIEREEADYYCFDAVEGSSYLFELSGDIWDTGWMNLLDRNACDDLSASYEWNSTMMTMEWTCEISGRYFVEVEDWDSGGSYQIRMRTPTAGSAGFQYPDFDGDETTDLLWENTSNSANYITMIHDGVRSPFQYIANSTGGTLEIVDLADFNGDGTTDLLWENTSTSANFITLVNDGVRGPFLYIANSTGGTLEIVDLSDFDGDGTTDMLWEKTSTSANFITLVNDGIRGPFQYIADSAGGALEIMDLDDFNGDGGMDILWENTSTSANYITLMNGTVRGPFQYIANSSGGTLEIMDLSDFNGDGTTDLLWENTTTSANYITLMNNAVHGPFLFIPDSTGGSLEIMDLGDFNGDGTADILWENASNSANYITLINDGIRGPFQFLPDSTGGTLEVVDLGDFNGDGTTDLLWENASTSANYITLIDNGVCGPFRYIANSKGGALEILDLSD